MPDVTDLRRRVQDLAACLRKCLFGFLEHQRTRLRFLSQKTLQRELFSRLREAQQQLDVARDSLGKEVRGKIEHSQRLLLQAARALRDRAPAREILLRRQRFEEIGKRFFQAPNRLISDARDRFARMMDLLRVLGPEVTLRRGYSITMDPSGRLVRSVKSVAPAMKVRTRLSDGEFDSTVS